MMTAMTPERYRRLKELFEQAEDLSGPERSSFLSDLTKDDAELGPHLEALFRGDTAPGILNDPTLNLTEIVGSFSPSPETFRSGQTVRGRFTIEGLLGSGGMGEVYRAHDNRLDRIVALKVVREVLDRRPGFRHRLEHEARSISKLNHPHICSLFDVDQDGDKIFLVFEYLEGETLSARLQRGPLETDEWLQIAIDISGALSCAHTHGVVHRDLKPANIMLTASGAKLLDFGVAKASAATIDIADGVRQDSPIDSVITEHGLVLGTPAYMSPEQAEGKPVDARTDVFSFGSLLYEMVTGLRAFPGENPQAVFQSVLRADPPPMRTATRALRSEIEPLIRKCLKKNPSERFADVHGIRLALERLRRLRTHSRRRYLLLAIAAAVIAGVSLLLIRQNSKQGPPPSEVPLTSYGGLESDPDLSPDGSHYAFVWDGDQEDSPTQIYISQIGDNPSQLTHGFLAVRRPRWSPDGQHIAFIRFDGVKQRDQLVVVPASGGSERVLYGSEGWIDGPSWSPNGKLLYINVGLNNASVGAKAPGQTFAVVNIDGTKVETYSGQNGDIQCAASPDGRHLVFVRSYAYWVGDLFVFDLEEGKPSGSPHQLTRDGEFKFSPRWNGNNEIIFVRGDLVGDRSLWRLSLTTEAVQRIEGVGRDAADLSIREGVHRLVYTKAHDDYNVWRADLKAPDQPPLRLLASTRLDGHAQYSPDGHRIAFTSDRGRLRRQIYLANADGSNAVPITSFSNGVGGTPRWSPDGKFIAFDAWPSRTADIFVSPASVGSVRQLTREPSHDHLPSWSPDGRFIYFTSDRTGRREIFRVPVQGGTAVQITRNGGWMALPSPDGKWIYCSKLTSGVFRVPSEGGRWSYYDKLIGNIFRVPSEGGDEQELVHNAVLSHFTVTPKGIYFIEPRPKGGGVLKLRSPDGQIQTFSLTFNKIPDMHLSVSPDERWLLFTRVDQSLSDLVLIEGFR